MRISRRPYYGLRALSALAASDRPLSVHELASSERMPEDFLEKILQALRRASIVESHKGTDGGYALTRPAALISVWDVVVALDSPVQAFLPPTEKGQLPCSLPTHCRTNEIWRTLTREIERTLSGITLENLGSPSDQPKP